MRVLKRDGTLQAVRLDAITNRLVKLCTGLGEDFDPLPVASNVAGQLADGMTTESLDHLAAEAAAALATSDPRYSELAARIVVSNLHKTTKPSVLETFEAMQTLSPSFLEVVRDNQEELQSIVDYERDYMFSSFFAIKTLVKLYLGKSKDGKVIERPQQLYLRVAIQLYGADMKEVRRVYRELSSHEYTHASPCLFNAGAIKAQLSSCFLLTVPDDLEEMFVTFGEAAQISKTGGGLGMDVSSVRGKNAPIKTTGGQSDGLVPFMRCCQEVIRWINQSGRRKGSCALYLEPHHPDTMAFLKMKLNSGDETQRARDLFYAIWASDHFMNRVLADERWSFFDPSLCPGLSEAVGEDYTALYERYEAEGRATEQVRARDVWSAMLKSQIETGGPFVLFKDHANRKSNQKNLGTIKCSNLCTEIIEFTSADEVAVCTLASLNLRAFVTFDEDEGKATYDFVGLGAATRSLVKNLNRVIDTGYYPCQRAEVSNRRHRPLGIGIQGLADAFLAMRYPFDSDEAMALNAKIAATIYYHALAQSCELARADGPYATFAGCPASQGILQFDMWDVKPHVDFDWEALKADIASHGLRNSLLVAPMPTASTSQLLGNNQSFEPFASLFFTRRTAAGDYDIVVPQLVNDLKALGLWNDSMRDQILAAGGSIQRIAVIPDDLKRLYKTSYEVPQKVLIDMAAERGPYVCQSQSLSLFFEAPVSANKLSAALFHGWNRGLKTGMYYLYSRAAVTASTTGFQSISTATAAGGGGGCSACEG